jgi:hypothetical protein
MADGELFTHELSKGKVRQTGARLSDLGTVPTEDERSRDRGERGRFKAGNKAAANRSAKQALTAPLRAARTRVREAVEGQGRSLADALLSDAMAVYASARLELGSASVFVLAPLTSFATESVLAQHFTKLAAELGFDTERGLLMLETAHRCETQAQRAMTAALAAKKALPKAGKAAADWSWIQPEEPAK